MSNDLISRKLVYADDIYRYIKTEINPCGKPFDGSAYEFGLKVMGYIENMSAAYDVDKVVELEKENEEMKEVIRKLLCSEYGSSCQFCIQDNNNNAMCMKMGGSGSWCCENATYDRDWNKRQVK